MKKIINYRVVHRQIFHYPFELDIKRLRKCNPPYEGSTFKEFKIYFNKYILDRTSRNNNEPDEFPYLNLDWFERNKELMGEELLKSLKSWESKEGQSSRDYYDPSIPEMVDSNTLEIDIVEDENSENLFDW